jgi:uncharacterized protein
VITSCILAATASHDCTLPPLTRQGALVAVTNAADMTRGQVAFDREKTDIHAISAMAVVRVSIQAGEQIPAHIEVEITNPAGLWHKADPQSSGELPERSRGPLLLLFQCVLEPVSS